MTGHVDTEDNLLPDFALATTQSRKQFTRVRRPLDWPIWNAVAQELGSSNALFAESAAFESLDFMLR